MAIFVNWMFWVARKQTEPLYSLVVEFGFHTKWNTAYQHIYQLSSTIQYVNEIQIYDMASHTIEIKWNSTESSILKFGITDKSKHGNGVHLKLKALDCIIVLINTLKWTTYTRLLEFMEILNLEQGNTHHPHLVVLFNIHFYPSSAQTV